MKAFASAYIVLLLASCAAPTQVEESIAAGYITIETLAETALTAFQDGYIDSDDRDQIVIWLQEAQNGLNLATQIADTSSTVEALTYVSQAYELFAKIRGLINGPPNSRNDS